MSIPELAKSVNTRGGGMYIERIADHPDVGEPIEKMRDFEIEIKQSQILSSLFAWPHLPVSKKQFSQIPKDLKPQ